MPHNHTGMRAQLTVIIACFIAGGVIAQSAVCDLTFNPDDIGFGAGSGFFEPWGPSNGRGLCMVVQTDDKVLVGGDWGPSDAWLNKKLVRLNANGRIDQTFITGSGFNDAVHCIQLVAGGKIMVGGAFTTFNGMPCNRICRLNADGTLDPTFVAALGCDAIVRDIQPVTGNKYVIGGDFTSAGGAGRNRLARLNFDGINDATFNVAGSGVVGQVRTLALQTDGRVLVGGAIASYNGVARSNLFRILTNGAIDATYLATAGSGANGTVNDIEIAGTGHVVVGEFDQVNGVASDGLCKLSSGGVIDPLFGGIAWWPYVKGVDALVMPDGSVAIVRSASSDGDDLFNSERRTVFACTAAGDFIDHPIRVGIDEAVRRRLALPSGFAGYIYSPTHLIALTPSGGLIWLGEFTRAGIMRLNADMSFDPTFHCGYGLLYSSVWRSSLLDESDPREYLPAIERGMNDELWLANANLDGNGYFDGVMRRDANGYSIPGSESSDRTVVSDWFYAISTNSDGEPAVSKGFTTYTKYTAEGANTHDDHTVVGLPKYWTGRNAMVWYPDGRLLVGGVERAERGDASFDILSRYLTTNVPDPAFTVPVGATQDERVEAVALATSGRIYIAGTFSAINGTPRSRIARLLDNGTLDLTFDPLGGFNDTVRDILEMPDGTLVCTGDFTTYRGVSAPGICRLNPDATLDATFDVSTGLNGEGWKLLRRDDGLIFVSGRFSQYNGVARGSLVAINNDGSVNTAFDTGVGFRDNFGNVAVVNDFVIQSSGQVVVVGEFTQYQGIGRNRIARIGEPGVARVALRMLLDGPWNGNSMSDGLRVNGLVPLKEPYKALGYPHVTGGNEQTTLGVLNFQGNNTIVDWVVVELRDPTAPGVVQRSRSALLQRDGDVVEADGSSPITFYGISGAERISVRHRNHLGIVTANSYTLGSNTLTLDLSALNVPMFGIEARKNNSGKWCLWSGDVTGSGSVQYTGAGNDRDPILLQVGSTSPNNTSIAYSTADVNLDGVLKYTGPGNDRDPILLTVGSTTPNNTRSAQLP